MIITTEPQWISQRAVRFYAMAIVILNALQESDALSASTLVTHAPELWEQKPIEADLADLVRRGWIEQHPTTPPTYSLSPKGREFEDLQFIR